MSNVIGRLSLATGLVLLLAGCIQPLHGNWRGSNVSEQLAQIEVTAIEGHLGHQIKSELDFVLSNGKPPEKPKYRLTIRPTSSTAGVVSSSTQGRPQVMNQTVQANYQLVSISDGESLASGTATVFASFDRSQQRFGNVRALRDAEIRAAKEVAEQIRARITPGLLAPRN